MVTGPNCEQVFVALIAAAQPDPVLERLDPPRRLAVVMAIIAIVLTGLLLVACTMLGANWVRRMARQKPRPLRADNATRASAENRRLRESLQGVLPDVDSKDTIHMDGATGETKVDP